MKGVCLKHPCFPRSGLTSKVAEGAEGETGRVTFIKSEERGSRSLSFSYRTCRFLLHLSDGETNTAGN